MVSNSLKPNTLMCTRLSYVIRFHNNVTNRIPKTAIKINFLACNVLHKSYLGYFQEVLRNSNSSKESHKVNNIFSHLHVTENTL